MPQQRKKVLFVDDDLRFLEIVQILMAQYAGSAWEILTASDTAKALALMQERTPDLLVLDVHMPVVDGLQFLSVLQRKYPNVLKVVLTGDVTDRYRAACLSSGAELFLEKPSSAEGWQSVYATLNELIRFQPEEGFRGVLRRVGLQDVLQMECLARHSLALAVAAQGTIFIQDGQIIHAEAGGRIGEEAFNYLMSLRGGEFSLKPFFQPEMRSITGSWEFLLMEAARKRDEAMEEMGLQPEAPAPELPTADQPALMAEAQEVALSEDVAPGTLRRQIDEMLLCSAQGDILYQWQCADANAHIGFLEFVSQKARHLGQGLPLGDFERVETRDSRSRLVARIQSDRAMLVRSSQAAEQSAVATAGTPGV